MRLRLACWSPVNRTVSPANLRNIIRTTCPHWSPLPLNVAGYKPARVSESNARTHRTPNSESFRESSTPCEMFVRFGVDTYTEIRIRFSRNEGEKCCARHADPLVRHVLAGLRGWMETDEQMNGERLQRQRVCCRFVARKTQGTRNK